MKINYFDLKKKLKLTFKDKSLLIKSLTHKSFDKVHNNEKIEFLGDRVLGLIIAKKLLEIYPEEKEGVLDKKFASLVNKKTCLEIAKKIGLEKYILRSNTHNRKNLIEDKVLADSCEALIGCIYLDKGFQFVEKTILKLWSNHIKKSSITQIDAKTKLQEFSLKKFKEIPKYIFFKKTGPQHRPLFKTEVQITKTKKITGVGSSKKNAQQNAAAKLLKILNL